MKGSHDWEKDEDALDPNCFAFWLHIHREVTDDTLGLLLASIKAVIKTTKPNVTKSG